MHPLAAGEEALGEFHSEDDAEDDGDGDLGGGESAVQGQGEGS